MSFSNASSIIDDVSVVVDQQENEMPLISTTPSSSMAPLKRQHTDDGQQQREFHVKIARMETELRDTKQLGRISELELEKRALQAELREQKALAERSAMQAKIDKMEQEQQQQKKDNVSIAQFNAILARIGELEKGKGSDQKEILESIGRMEGVQQQQMDALKEQIVKSGAAQTELCAKIDQLERKQMADFEQLKHIYDKISLVLPNSWDSSACHEGLTITGPKCLGVHHKGKGFGYCSILAKHPIRSTNTSIFYFEMKVENVKGWVAIGLATKAMALDRLGMAIGLATKAMRLDGWVGHYKDSYGYKSNGYYWINGFAKREQPSFSAGDVVGCGVILATRQIIFTKNGQRLDTSDLSISTSSIDSLFPCVSLPFSGDKIKANFGPDFLFDVGALF